MTLNHDIEKAYEALTPKVIEAIVNAVLDDLREQCLENGAVGEAAVIQYAITIYNR